MARIKMHTSKVDNRSLASKVALRRWLLSRMHLTSVSVLDTCAGAGHIWSEMQKHVTVNAWIRCDVQPRQAGTLKLEASEAIRSLPLADVNVVDIDPYGEPWGAYAELLRRLTHPTAVFLTCGRVSIKQASRAALAFAGVPAAWGPELPRSPVLSDYIATLVLERTWEFASIDHAATVRVEKNNVQYYALALTPYTEGAARG